MKIDNPIGTTFTSESTNHDIKSEPNFSMMSEAGKKLAAKSAPTSLSKDNGKIPMSSMDRKMRGTR